MIFAIILSSLALLAAAAATGVCLWERKRNQERNTASQDAVFQYIERQFCVFNSQIQHYREEDAENLAGKLRLMEDRVQKLENGTIPDYEKAKEAANAVNSFNAGITGILGFDPYEALQAQRKKDIGGETD